MLLNEQNELQNRNLHIRGLLNKEKVDIQDTKVDIEKEKVDIEKEKVDIQDTTVDIESILSVNSRKSRYFNGHDKTIWVMIQGVVQTLFVRLPLAYIMSIQPNASLTMIGLVAPVSTVVVIVLNVSFYLWYNRGERKE